MSKITIQDVAKRANVSVATIDRVLNRRPGVRSQTVERVESAIRELNYQPDRIAARLLVHSADNSWRILPRHRR
jgi:LacI family transcriptional regulator